MLFFPFLCIKCRAIRCLLENEQSSFFPILSTLPKKSFSWWNACEVMALGTETISWLSCALILGCHIGRGVLCFSGKMWCWTSNGISKMEWKRKNPTKIIMKHLSCLRVSRNWLCTYIHNYWFENHFFGYILENIKRVFCKILSYYVWLHFICII